MAASDKYTATPGFHIGEAIGLIQDARANGVKRQHATDGLGLLTCASAAVGSSGKGELFSIVFPDTLHQLQDFNPLIARKR